MGYLDISTPQGVVDVCYIMVLPDGPDSRFIEIKASMGLRTLRYQSLYSNAALLQCRARELENGQLGT